MLALLLASTEPCMGPVVNTRQFRQVRFTGGKNEQFNIHYGPDILPDVVKIIDDDEFVADLHKEGKIQIEHTVASGNPVTVELI